MSRIQALSRSVLVFSLIGVLSGYVLAGETSDIQRTNQSMRQDEAISQRETPSQSSNLMLRRASSLIGSKVVSPQGKTLGTIYDLVLTPDHSTVSYVAVSRGGIFGIGRNLYAVPWSAVRMGATDAHYLPIQEEQLRTAAGFREAYWPTSAARGWAMGISESADVVYQGPTRAESREVQDRRVSKIIGMNVKDSSGLNSGSIEDFVVTLDSGKVAYTIVGFGGLLGLGREYAAVPPNAIELQPERNVARLDVDRSTLQASAFPSGQWPDLASPAYARRTSSLYGTQGDWVVLGYVPPERDTEMETPSRTPGAPASPTFNPATMRTISGTVVDLMKASRPAADAPDSLHLRLRTSDNRVIAVHLGPRDYISKQDFYIINGDNVTVTGSETTTAGTSIVIATQVAHDGKILRLRDQSGKPLWTQPESTTRSTGTAEESEHLEAEDEDLELDSDM